MSVCVTDSAARVEPLYGTADWAAGYTEGESAEEITSEAQEEADADAAAVVQGEVTSASEGWSYFQKGAIFAVIVGLVALYVRISRRRRPENQGYEKTMA